MKLKIEITMDNAAFGDCDIEQGEEAARIIADLAKHIESGVSQGYTRNLHDSNGNTVGKARVTP